MTTEEDKKSAFKLAQLLTLLKTTDIEITKKVLEHEGDINFAIPVNSPYSISKPHAIGFTALHFVCSSNIDLFKTLLSRGADFTKKDQNGNTVLHMFIMKKKTDIKEPLDNPYINAVLSAHISSNNLSNPCNNIGLSHFHIACMTNNAEAIEFFINNGVSVDAFVSLESDFFPGYTALHFAATCKNTKIVEILIMNGANTHITDVKGVTVLHILLKHKLEMHDLLRKSLSSKQDTLKKLEEQIRENEKIINMLLENISSDNDCLDNIGLSNFHVAWMLQDTTVAEQLADRLIDLDISVNKDSPLWPGYTALHFAAHVSIKSVEILIDKGANLLAEDSKKLTPLDICIERYNIEDVCDMMFLNANLRNILFSDGKTKLMTFLRTFADRDYFKNFLTSTIKNNNIQLPMESPLWPGYTPLHLAVHFSKKSEWAFENILKLCLKNGADLSLQDSKGRSALHLAYRLSRMRATRVILSECTEIPNVSDEDNLSHLHIVSALVLGNNTIKKCTFDNFDVNVVYKGTSTINDVRPGQTPLHVCLFREYNFLFVLKKLLKAGASPYIKDASDLTPVHRILEINDKSAGYIFEISKPLFMKISDSEAEESGLNHLHIACFINNEAAVKRLIKVGANVNLAIKCAQQNGDDSLKFLSRYDKCTPLTISNSISPGVIQMLVKNGADLFAKKADGSCALNNSQVLEYYILDVQKKTQLQLSMRREFGWTKLHLACYLRQISEFEKLVKKELVDVNAQVNSNSPIWKGYTPLRLLMSLGVDQRAYSMSKILLENGADVTAADDEGNTPIKMLMQLRMHTDKEKLRYEQAALLMKYYKDFHINPANTQGISYFHLACYLNDLDAVKGFLSHGVDVNQPIDFFANWNPGYTPLHLASKLEVVDLLMSHGGDVHKEDVSGCSVLAESLSRKDFDEDVVTKIIESGANINSYNISRRTPFEMVISKSAMTMEKLQFCIKQGFDVNSYNPVNGVGYIALVLEKNYSDKTIQLSIAEAIANENPMTNFGRSTLHNTVAGNSMSIYLEELLVLFEKTIKSSYDIDEQDDEGRTPLHLAIEFGNGTAVDALLRFGSDMNVLDKNGNLAISYCLKKPTFSHVHDSIKNTLVSHACKLNFLKLYLNKSNADAIAGKSIQDYAWRKFFLEQVAKTKQINIGVRLITLYDFLTETGAIMMYPSLNQSERSKIHEFFEEIKKDASLDYIQSIFRLQYRKAIKRTELLSLATNSFRLLLGFGLPDLCAENIFQYLCNSDLSNIMSAEVENDEMKMDVD